MPFVYIARCADGTLYVGHTDDLVKRLHMHNQGEGSTYTAKRRPVFFAYAEEYDCFERAIKRERQLKRWTVKKKEALIAGDLAALKRRIRA